MHRIEKFTPVKLQQEKIHQKEENLNILLRNIIAWYKTQKQTPQAQVCQE